MDLFIAQIRSRMAYLYISSYSLINFSHHQLIYNILISVGTSHSLKNPDNWSY